MTMVSGLDSRQVWSPSANGWFSLGAFQNQPKGDPLTHPSRRDGTVVQFYVAFVVPVRCVSARKLG